MIFHEKTYSVLVVSAGQKFDETLTRMLPPSEYYPVQFVRNIAAARREMLAKSFDFVIVNAPLPDDPGIRFAADACGQSKTVVLLLVPGDIYESVNARVVPEGVFTLSKPVAAQSLLQGLKWMAPARERLGKLEQKATSLEEKMQEIRQVNRAKWLLIENQGMSEGEAHRSIEKQAMDRCVSRRQVADEIIRAYP